MSRQRRFLRWSWLTVVGVLFLSATAYAQVTPAIPSLSSSQFQQLNEGEILVDVVVGEVPIGDAIGVIEATPEEVMEVLRNFDDHERVMSDMILAEILEYDGDVALCHGITDTPWPMEDREWVIRASDEVTQIDGMEVILSTFEYVEGSGNLEDINGYWLFIPWGADGSHTLARYHLEVDLGTWLPDFLLEWSTENFLPIKIQGLRDYLAL